MPSEPFSFDLLSANLAIGAALVAIGMIGFVARRNLIVMFLSAEMMLQGVALTLVAFGRYHGNWTGQVLTIMILAVAACEAAIALVLVLVLYGRRHSLDASLWQDIRDPGQPPTLDRPEEAEPIEPGTDLGPEAYPHLTPAGIEPPHASTPWIERRD
jgi:NADH-quinone oxidoreductase subunit K